MTHGSERTDHVRDDHALGARDGGSILTAPVRPGSYSASTRTQGLRHGCDRWSVSPGSVLLDTSVSSRALMLIWALLPTIRYREAQGAAAFISQGEVECLTLRDRQTVVRDGGLLVEVEAGDWLHLDDRGTPGDPQGAGTWSIGAGSWSGWSRDGLLESSGPWHALLREDLAGCGNMPTRHVRWDEVMNPANDIWHKSPVYGAHLWRLASLIGPHDTVLSIGAIAEALGTNQKTTSRLVKAGCDAEVITTFTDDGQRLGPGTCRWLGHALAAPSGTYIWQPRSGFGTQNVRYQKHEKQKRRFTDFEMTNAMARIRRNFEGLRQQFDEERVSDRRRLIRLETALRDDDKLREYLTPPERPPIVIDRDLLGNRNFRGGGSASP